VGSADLVQLFDAKDFFGVIAAVDARLPRASLSERPLLLKLLAASQDRLKMFQEARQTYEQAVALTPGDVELLNNYAVLLKQIGEFELAKTFFVDSLRVSTTPKHAYLNFADLLIENKQWKFASVVLAIAYERGASSFGLLKRLVFVHSRTPSHAKCIEIYEKNLSVLEGDLQSLKAYGKALNAVRRKIDAMKVYEKVVALHPNDWESMSTLGLIERSSQNIQSSLQWFERAIAVNPKSAELYTNYGVALTEAGRVQDGMDAYREALAIKQNLWVSRSNYIFSSNYLPETSGKTLREFAEEFGRLVCETYGRPSLYNAKRTRRPRPQRIGFVTADLMAHPVCYFLHALLSNSNAKRFEFFAYSARQEEDSYTQKVRPFFKKFVKINGLSDNDAAHLIANDDIDVLIDIAGHTAGNRLPVVQYRPAPLQVTWLGYCATTGMASIDYIIGDKVVTPRGDQSQFVEKIYQLPNVYFCYSVPIESVPVGPSPSLANGYITFGCFNNIAKVGAGVKRLWANILKAIPDSRLVLKYRPLADRGIRAELTEEFQALGIAPERIILEGFEGMRNYFMRYGGIDICLDPFPYPGGTTTIDALWMGVPTITLAGERFLSRNGETILRAVGMSSWVSKTEDEYLVLAVKWSKKQKDLGDIRRDLRSKLESSPLMDGKKFSADFEVALDAMWAEKFAPLIPPKESGARQTSPANKTRSLSPSKSLKPSTSPNAGKLSRK
jgi:protein O-GlcNAc transferase